jgi:hypothetical protein
VSWQVPGSLVQRLATGAFAMALKQRQPEAGCFITVIEASNMPTIAININSSNKGFCAT